jgi:hypothetical protein
MRKHRDAHSSHPSRLVVSAARALDFMVVLRMKAFEVDRSSVFVVIALASVRLQVH